VADERHHFALVQIERSAADGLDPAIVFGDFGYVHSLRHRTSSAAGRAGGDMRG
jgi:hypothetical protein